MNEQVGPEENIFLKDSTDRKRIGFFDVTESVEERARDIADARVRKAHEKEMEETGEGTGFWSRQKKRIAKGFKSWKHTVFGEYKKQKEVIKVREEIKRSGNLYLDKQNSDADLTDRAKQATVERMVSHYEEVYHREAGEKRQTIDNPALKAVIQDVIRDYASGRIATKDDFNAVKRSRIEALVQNNAIPPEVATQGVGYADNIFMVAQHARAAVEHGIAVENLDLNFEVLVGQARMGAKTKTELSWLDRTMNRLSKSRIGSLIPEATIAAAATAVYTAGRLVSQGLLRKALNVVAFGGGSLASGALAAKREAKRLREERTQLTREKEQGQTINDSEMADKLYDMADARDLISALDQSLHNTRTGGGRELKDSLDQQEMEALQKALTDIDARIKIWSKRKIGLIRHSDLAKVDEENTELEIAKARAKAHFRSLFDAGKIPPGVQVPLSLQTQGLPRFDQYYEFLVEHRSNELLNNEITQRDRAFNKMKRNRAWKKFAQGVVAGVIVGGVAHQAAGWIQDAFGVHRPQTPLEHFLYPGSHWRGGGLHTETIPMGGGSSFEMQIPNGAQMVVEGDHFYLADAKGNHLFDNIKLNQDHSLSQDTLDALHAKGIDADNIIQPGKEASGDWWKQHLSENKRVDWHDEPGPRYSNFYHKLIEFEGKQQMLYVKRDADGVYVDLNAMMKNLAKNAQHAFKIFGTNPDGSVDSKLLHLRDQLVQGYKSGELAKHMQLAIIPTEDANAHGLSMLIPEADANGHIRLPKEISDLFTTEKSLHYLHHPLRFMEARFNGHTLATTIGHEATPMAIAAPEYTPVINFPGEHDDWDLPPSMPVPLSHKGPKASSIAEHQRAMRGESYYGYGYGAGGEHGLLDRNKYKDRMAAELVANPELNTGGDDSQLISEYLNRQDPAYLAELRLIIQDAPSMNQNIEAVITVPAYQEGKNLEKTIRNYAKLKNRDRFEIVILENHPRDKNRDNTAEVVQRMRQEFPDITIVHLRHVFEEKRPIGEIRKYLTDAVLLRKQEADIKHSLALISNGADLENIDPNYISRILHAFKQSPELDAIAGKWDYPTDIYEKFPLLHASQRLWHYFDIVFRHRYLKSPELIGRNSAFRSGTYAAIGGYNKEAKLAEDLEIGWLIKDARNYDSSRVRYLNSAGLVSNPRRAIKKMLEQNGSLVSQYGDFHSNTTVYESEFEQLLAGKRDFNPDEFKAQVQAIYDYYARWKRSNGGWVEDAPIETSFKKAMDFLGVQYQINNGQISINNLSKLTELLNNFARRSARTRSKERIPFQSDRLEDIDDDEPTETRTPESSDTRNETERFKNILGRNGQIQNLQTRRSLLPNGDQAANNTEAQKLRRLIRDHKYDELFADLKAKREVTTGGLVARSRRNASLKRLENEIRDLNNEAKAAFDRAQA